MKAESRARFVITVTRRDGTVVNTIPTSTRRPRAEAALTRVKYEYRQKVSSREYTTLTFEVK